MGVCVCVFTNDEGQSLPDCIRSLYFAGLDAHDKIHILTKGCGDDVVSLAYMLTTADSRITVHELPISDSANAWNDYVHRIADCSIPVHIFIDASVKASAGTLLAFDRAMQNAPDSYAGAALPVTGRSRRKWATQLLKHHYLSKHLYALSNTAISEFREKNIYLPFEAHGTDGLLSYLLLTNMSGGADDSHDNRITMVEEATFEFTSLMPNFHDVKRYWKRLTHYSKRHLQNQILYRILKKQGVGAMPNTINEIYTPATLASLRPRLDIVNFWFDIATLRQLNHKAPSLMVPKAAKLKTR